MSIPEELKDLLTAAMLAVEKEADELYRDYGENIKKADLHYLAHEQLEFVLESVGVTNEEKMRLRREVGRPLHLLIARGEGTRPLS